MPSQQDKATLAILDTITKSHEPLETTEVVGMLKNVSRTQVLYRLHILRGDALIKGKQVGAGKQTWIWWKQ